MIEIEMMDSVHTMYGVTVEIFYYSGAMLITTLKGMMKSILLIC